MFLQAMATGIAVAAYYGLLPLFYGFSVWRLKGRLFFALLLCVLFCCAPFALGQKGYLLSLFLAFHFLIPILVTCIGGWKDLSYERIFWVAQVPLWIALVVLGLVPGWLDSLGVTFEQTFDLLTKQMAGNAKAAEQAANMPFNGQQIAALLPGWIALDSGLRFLISGWMLGLWRRFPILPRPLKWQSLKFADWPIWLVVVSLAGVAFGMTSDAKDWTIRASWILMALLPFYLARGVSAISFYFGNRYEKKPAPIAMKWLGLLLLFWVWPYLMMGAVVLGLIDTWFPLRREFKRK